MKPKPASLTSRLRYAFDRTLSKGPLALVAWLAGISALFILACTLVAVLGHLNPNLDAFQIFWDMLLQALAPNPVDVNIGPRPFLLAMLVITLGGIFMVSTFIGLTTNAIDHRVQALRKGRSQVLEQNHTLILGWDEHIFTILSELVIANQNQTRSCIVILGDKDKVEMEDEIRERLHTTGRTGVVCRCGSPMDIVDLKITSLDSAKSIIILAPDGEAPDSCVIKTLLAITNNPNRRPEPYHIVTEIHDPENIEAAQLVGKGEAVLLPMSDIIAHITAQTCRQSGLSVVYTELLNFEGDEIYFQEEPELAGKTFGEALSMYEDSSVIGLRPKDGKLKLNPPMQTVIRPGDKIIAISDDDDTVILSGMTTIPVQASAICLGAPAPALPERTLILGWNEEGETIVRELDHYVASGSQVTVVASAAIIEDQPSRVQEQLKNQVVTFQAGEITSRKTINSLGVESYTHVIVLSEGPRAQPQVADARTLVTLLHLRDINEHAGRPFSIVTEMLDVRNRTLANITRADDFIVSDELSSLLMAQISENKDLIQVFDDLFYPEGSEIYIKPIADYIRLHQHVNFYTVLEAARQKGEVAIGYRLGHQAEDPSISFGVVINPAKSNELVFSEGDRVIVLAEA